MHRLFSSVAAVALVSTLAAQSPCHSSSNNNLFDTNVSMGGPNLLVAIKTTSSVALNATRAEVWTGEATGTNSLGLWSHDAVGNKPASNLGTATWSMAAANGFQGANFNTPISIAANATFWIVWGPINGAQASVELQSSPMGQQYRGSFDGGQSWTGPFQGHLWKFRIFCGTPGNYQVFGAGCRGSNGQTPALSATGVPTIGQNMTLVLQNGLPMSQSYFVFGSSDTMWLNLTLPFDLTALNAPGCMVLCSMDVLVSLPTDPSGGASLPLAVPPNPSLVGQNFFNQVWVVDPSANGLGFVGSNAGKATIGS